ncbi:MAG TPA: hypothetical protein V6C81_07220 [Planktothrix sp.]
MTRELSAPTPKNIAAPFQKPKPNASIEDKSGFVSLKPNASIEDKSGFVSIKPNASIEDKSGFVSIKPNASIEDKSGFVSIKPNASIEDKSGFVSIKPNASIEDKSGFVSPKPNASLKDDCGFVTTKPAVAENTGLVFSKFSVVLSAGCALAPKGQIQRSHGTSGNLGNSNFPYPLLIRKKMKTANFIHGVTANTEKYTKPQTLVLNDSVKSCCQTARVQYAVAPMSFTTSHVKRGFTAAVTRLGDASSFLSTCRSPGGCIAFAVAPVALVNLIAPGKSSFLSPKSADITDSSSSHELTLVTEIRDLPGFLASGIGGLKKFMEKVGEQHESPGRERKNPARKNTKVLSQRMLYLVRENETLEMIARSELGDSRYLDLIVTINRAEVHKLKQGDVLVPVVYTGQQIWLPSQSELSIYKKNFFRSKNGNAGKGLYFNAMSLNSGSSTTNLPQVERPRSNSQKHRVEAPTHVLWADRFIDRDQLAGKDGATSLHYFDATPSIVGSPGRLADILNDVRFSGNRHSIRIDRLNESQISERRCYQVRLGETLESVALRDPLIGDVQLWTLIAKINGMSTELDADGRTVAKLVQGQYLVLPTTAEMAEFKLLDKLNRAAGERTKVIDGKPPSPFGELFSTLQNLQRSMKSSSKVESLSDFCKLIVFRSDTAEGVVHNIKLQAWITGCWQMIASYDCTPQASTRTISRSDGKSELLRIDLPPEIAEQMATEDFRRNWHFYYNHYFIQQQANLVSTDMNMQPNV